MYLVSSEYLLILRVYIYTNFIFLPSGYKSIIAFPEAVGIVKQGVCCCLRERNKKHDFVSKDVAMYLKIRLLLEKFNEFLQRSPIKLG